MDYPSGLSLLHWIILPVLTAGREGDPNPFISRLRADASLDTGALSHVSLQDEGCIALFEWLTKGGFLVLFQKR